MMWRTLAEELAAILALPPGWDSYGAPAIDANAITQASKVLQSVTEPNTPAPYVLPTPRGGVQFEWHTKEIDLEIEVSPGNEVYFLLNDIKGEKEYEGELASHQGLVRDAISRLSA